jgi:hypothetical protein
MASPLLFGAVLAGGYYLYKKFNESHIPGSKGNATSAKPGPVVQDPASGTKFQAQTVSVFPDGIKMVDIFTTSGSRIVRFSQQGSDMNSRVEITSPPGVDPAIKAAAMRAFGVRPKAA